MIILASLFETYALNITERANTKPRKTFHRQFTTLFDREPIIMITKLHGFAVQLPQVIFTHIQTMQPRKFSMS